MMRSAIHFALASVLVMVAANTADASRQPPPWSTGPWRNDCFTDNTSIILCCGDWNDWNDKRWEGCSGDAWSSANSEATITIDENLGKNDTWATRNQYNDKKGWNAGTVSGGEVMTDGVHYWEVSIQSYDSDIIQDGYKSMLFGVSAPMAGGGSGYADPTKTVWYLSGLNLRTYKTGGTGNNGQGDGTRQATSADSKVDQTGSINEGLSSKQLDNDPLRNCNKACQDMNYDTTPDKLGMLLDLTAGSLTFYRNIGAKIAEKEAGMVHSRWENLGGFSSGVTGPVVRTVEIASGVAVVLDTEAPIPTRTGDYWDINTISPDITVSGGRSSDGQLLYSDIVAKYRHASQGYQPQAVMGNEIMKDGVHWWTVTVLEDNDNGNGYNGVNIGVSYYNSANLATATAANNDVWYFNGRTGGLYGNGKGGNGEIADASDPQGQITGPTITQSGTVPGDEIGVLLNLTAKTLTFYRNGEVYGPGFSGLNPYGQFVKAVQMKTTGMVVRLDTQFAPTPTQLPTPGPTANPSPGPTTNPSPGPTTNPSPGPTTNPSPGPTTNPSPGPTTNPTPSPTSPPTPGPTTSPTLGPVNVAAAAYDVALQNVSAVISAEDGCYNSTGAAKDAIKMLKSKFAAYKLEVRKRSGTALFSSGPEYKKKQQTFATAKRALRMLKRKARLSGKNCGLAGAE